MPNDHSPNEDRVRAAMYGRVSTSEQVEGTSPQEQRNRCRGRIESEGWAFVGEYFDEGVSGSKASRPRLDALMAECRAGDIDVIVVSRLDRFGRSNRHLENALGDLDDLGVRFVSLSESFDSTTASGRFMRTMLGGASQFERESIRERTMGGLAATARAGFWPGGPPPFGFQTLPEGNHKRLVLFEQEAEVLRTAVTLLVEERLTTKEAADRLNMLGMKPRRVSRWTYHNLRRTLLDASLSGEWIYARPRGRGKKPKGSPPLPMTIPAIIPRERHEQLHEVLRSTSNIRRRANTYLLVGGRLISSCGSRYQGYPRPDGRRQYRCSSHRTYAEKRCDCRMIDANDVEVGVWSAVCEFLGDADRLTAMAADYIGLRSEQGKIERSQLVEVHRRVTRLGEALARAYEDRYREGRDRPAIDLAIARIEADLVDARTHEAMIAAWEADNQAAAGRVRGLRELADLASIRLLAMSVSDKRRVLDLLDVRSLVVAWAVCTNCAGRGKVSSKPKVGGTPCPSCHMTRWLPTLSIEGVVYQRLLQDTLRRKSSGGHKDLGLPFRLDQVSVVV